MKCYKISSVKTILKYFTESTLFYDSIMNLFALSHLFMEQITKQ